MVKSVPSALIGTKPAIKRIAATTCFLPSMKGVLHNKASSACGHLAVTTGTTDPMHTASLTGARLPPQKPAGTRTVGRSARHMCYCYLFLSNASALSRDSNARHASTWGFRNRHLEQLGQELERFAVPARQ